jgi:hypothetical protein
MNEAEKYINEHTRHCSNELVPSGYHEWVTPDDALRACEITKQEIIEKTCEFFYSISCCEWVEDIEVKELVKKYKKFMEE